MPHKALVGSAVHELRPRVTPRPCPSCGTDVDPLRAARVRLGDDGYRFLCSEACEAAFDRGERRHDRPLPIPAASPERRIRRDPTTGRIVAQGYETLDQLTPLKRRKQPAPLPTPPVPAVGLVAFVGAMLLSLGANQPTFAWVAAACATLAIAATLTAVHAQQGDDDSVQAEGVATWWVGAFGASLAIIAALVSTQRSEDPWLPMLGAALCSGALVLRAWLDARFRLPVAQQQADLAQRLPPTVRIPIESDPLGTEVTYREVHTEAVHTGEPVVALAGEVVAVDGVVQAGQALVLLHPLAETPVLRGAGDPVLAGATLTHGALRILSTRVGRDRALSRPETFGSAIHPRASVLVKLTAQMSRWGAVATAAASGLSVLFALDVTLVEQLSAAAAVLVSVPLLAIRRAPESVLRAAAAASAARGIVFPNPRSMETAGRTSLAAISARGTLTEGHLSVMEMHGVAETRDPQQLLPLVRAAESAAEGHPIADAIVRHTDALHLRPESVRRASFLPGRGVTALAPDGELIAIGNRQLLLDEGISVALADSEAQHAEERGYTTLFVGLGGRVRAIIALDDPIRPGARAAVQRIFDLGVEVVLLSGDHRTTTEVLAGHLDVANVRADLLPKERGSEVAKLRETGAVVAAVGRPKVDDSTLAAADVPMVLGAAGGLPPAGASDRAITLSTDDPRDAAAALWIARAARSTALRTVLACLVAGGVLMTAGALGILAPGVAALGALALDGFALPAAARLLTRIELRLPNRS